MPPAGSPAPVRRVTNTIKVTATRGADPRNTFLIPAEVMLRYGWGRTKGYETLRERRHGFPPAIAGRYRLDTLLAWEDQQLQAAGWDPDPTSPTPAAAPQPAPVLPAKRKAGRKAAA